MFLRNCSDERSFSQLKLIKNELCMMQEWLNCLSN